MGLFGSGGGTLGLGGTAWDPTTWDYDLSDPSWVLPPWLGGDNSGGAGTTEQTLYDPPSTSLNEGPITGINPPDSGTWLNPRQGVNLGVPIIYGTRRIGGHIIYQAMSDNENMLYMVYSLAEGIQQAWTMYIDDGEGVMIDFDSSKYKSSTVKLQNTSTGDTSTSLAVQHLFRNNISTGTSDGLVTTPTDFQSGLGGLWTTEHNCKGVAIEGLALLYDNVRQFGNAAHSGRGQSDYFEIEPFFRSGVPKIQFEMTGVALVDENGGAESSSDPAWVLYNYLTNSTYGCGLDATLINAASFTTASTICNVTSDSTKRYECNIILDSRASLIDNIKRILSCCNGHLNWINGQYYLHIDDEFTGTAVFAFEEKHIIGGLGIIANSKTERTNQVTCQFVNPDKSWEEDEVSWPDKNNESALYDSYLDADLSIPLRKTILVNGVTNYNQARFLAKQACLRSRNALKVSFVTTSEAMDVVVGDVITVTHSTPAWTAKEFRVRSITLNMDGSCAITAAEQVDATYAWDYIAPPSASDDTNLPDVTTVTAPSALSISETTYQGIASGGRKIRVTLDWLRSDNIFMERHEVEFKKSSDSTWTEAGATVGNTLVLNDFEIGDFDFRVRAINSIGSKSEWATIINEAVEGITDLPETVTGLTVNNHGDNVVVTWDDPVDSTDVSHIAIGVLQTDSTEWDDAEIIATAGVGTTTIVVPVIQGNYVAKWVGSGGLESIDYMDSGSVTVYGSELVATYAEQVAWAGTISGLYVTEEDAADVLKFVGTEDWDDFVAQMDSWGLVDSMGGRAELATYTGLKRDLGAVLPARIYTNKIFTSIVTDGSNYLDTWTDIDGRSSWDQVDKLDKLVTQIRTTQDDPADGGADWTNYKPFIISDVVARGLQLKVDFDQFSENEQFTLRELELLVDMVVRFESDRAKTATSITYDDPFYNIPDLVVTPINLATGDYMAITAETKTGFDINFYNSSAVAQTRTYNYQARGY